MMIFKSLSSVVFGFFALAIGVYVSSCTDPNYEIGGEYLPNDHETTVGSFEAAAGSITTRHTTDSTISSTYQGTGAFGFQRSADFGTRRCGFVSRFRPAYTLSEDVFGYDPIIDSVVMYFSISNWGGDTTQTVRYNVYEVTDGSFMDNDDEEFDACVSSVIEAELAKSGVVNSERLFSFLFPDQDNGIYSNSTYAKIDYISEAGYDYLDRLMLQTSELKDYYELYEYDEEEFGEFFQGLVLRPADDADQNFTTGGSTFTFDFYSSGFGFYARSKYEKDPTMIKDTVGMTYVFIDQYSDLEDFFTSNLYDYDYSGTVVEQTDSYETMLVEGLAGVVSNVVLEQSFFEDIEAIIEASNVENEGSDYTSIFFNSARLSLYLDSATGYDGYSNDDASIDILNYLPTRQGGYNIYSTLYDEDYEDEDYMEVEMVADYDYASEYSTGTASSFGGYLNRTYGCYVLSIPLQLQDIWLDYKDWKESGDDWSTVDWNYIIIAPVFESLSTPRSVKLQGPTSTLGAPLTLKMTYTLFKE